MINIFHFITAISGYMPQIWILFSSLLDARTKICKKWNWTSPFWGWSQIGLKTGRFYCIGQISSTFRCLQFQFLNSLHQMDMRKNQMCERLFSMMAGPICLLYFLYMYLVIRLIPRIQFIPPCLPLCVFSNFSFSF